MKSIRKRLTYANVMSSLAVFLILGGATAIAAKKIGSHQLKANSVTTAKIKKGAVTSKKIKDGAITTAKIGDAAVTGGKIDAGTTPFARVVAKLRGNGSLGLDEALQSYPLTPATYTQGAEEDDWFMGAVEVTFEPACEPPRTAGALVLVDAPSPNKPEGGQEIVARGSVVDKSGGTVSERIELAPYISARFEPGTPTPHTVSLEVEGTCNGGSGIMETSGAVDVIGVK
jgi:hypothetical protein